MAHNDLAFNLAVMKYHNFGHGNADEQITIERVEEIWACFIRIVDAIVAHVDPTRPWYHRSIEVDRFFEVLETGLRK